MKHLSRKKVAIIGAFATVVGLVGILASFSVTPQPTYAETTQPIASEVQTIESAGTPVATVISGRPTRISAPSVGIDLPVVDGFYNQSTGEWTLNPKQAQFATPSKLPNNENGTTYIYGHDTQAVFNRLHKLKVGAEVALSTDNGHLFIYRFTDSVITTPYAVAEVTAPSEEPRLSLQTCYGPTSADRRIFHFEFVRVEKI
jgi:LPXTG-site transpeptidase (sortase) family protein